jgi:pimeloyl-ACP methyl ester carboxylesterase
VRPMTAEQLFDSLGSDDVLLFVHGFANTFDGAVLRSAQLRYDVDFPGQILCFSWPSAGDINDYAKDGQQAAASVDALAALLGSLVSTPLPSGQRRKVHVFAHSMGNRVVLNAVFLLMTREGAKASDKPLSQIVLAAPDVGATEFNYLVDYAIDSAVRVTYYFSRLDSALRVSQKLNAYQPVGLLPYFERGLDTICADHTDTCFLGHTYYATSDRVLDDLHLLFTQGLAPAARTPPLAGRSAIFGHDYWSFVPTTVEAGGAASASPAK